MSSISSSAASSAWEREYAESDKAGGSYNGNAAHTVGQQSPLTELKLRVHTLRDDVERSAALHHKANQTCADHRRELTMLQEKEHAVFAANEDRLKMEVHRVLEMNKLLRERLERQIREEEEALQKTLETTRTENKVKINGLEETLNTLKETWEEVQLESERVELMKSNEERELSNALHIRTQLEHSVKEMQSKVQLHTNERLVRFSETSRANQEPHATHNKSNTNVTYHVNNNNDGNIDNTPSTENYVNREENDGNTLLNEMNRNELKRMKMLRESSNNNNSNNNKNSEVHLTALPIPTSATVDQTVDKMVRSAHNGHDTTHQPCAMSELKLPCYAHETPSSSSTFTASLSSSCSSLEEHELNATPFMYKQPSLVQSVFVPTGITDTERATVPASHHIASLVSTIKRRNTYLPRSFYARHRIDLHLCQSPFRDRINEIREGAALRESNAMLCNVRYASPLLELPIKYTDATNAFGKDQVEETSLLNSNEQTNYKIHRKPHNDDDIQHLHSEWYKEQEQQKEEAQEKEEENLTKETQSKVQNVNNNWEECHRNNDDDGKSNNVNHRIEAKQTENHVNNINIKELHRKHENDLKHKTLRHTSVEQSLDKVCKTLLYELSCLQCEYAECELKLCRSENNSKRNVNDNDVVRVSKRMRETMKAIERKAAQLQTLRQLERKLHHTVNIHNTLRSVVKENHYCDEIYSSVLELLRCGEEANKKKMFELKAEVHK